MNNYVLILISLSVFTLIHSSPILGEWREISLSANETIINRTINTAIQHWQKEKGYLSSSNNYISLALFEQIQEGINYQLYIAAHKKRSNSVDLFKYITHIHSLTDKTPEITVIEAEELKQTKEINRDEVDWGKMRNGISKYFYWNGGEQIGTTIKIEKNYRQCLYHTGFYIVELKVGERSKVENWIVMEKEDGSYQGIHKLDLN